MLQKVTARFYVSQITKFPGRKDAKIEFQPAYAGGANHEWAVASPSGKIEMYVTNPAAIEFFQTAMESPNPMECIGVEFFVVESTPPVK